MKAELDNISIVLHRPRRPENIGAAARAARNMGIHRLVVVDPVDCDQVRMLKVATHEARDIVENMEIHDDLREALSPFGYIVGTTARTGSHRQTTKSPRRMAGEIAAISRENRVALLFGPEDRGLSTSDLKYCHSLVTIPTADFSSLNLAQAVMVIAYELFTVDPDEPKPFVPRFAASSDLEGMYDQLSETLARIHFINPENPEYWMMSVRRFFTRIGLLARDVKIIRGICRQIDWYCERQGR